uniref:Nucleotide-diphospho-sugar transferase domain-containing protein n=1 Tax=Vitrella brassicaformis TaxID=1169539 RepID=A0A7S1JMX1_9ALVE
MHNLPFEDHTFDFVFANVFDRTHCPFSFAAEIERVLRPNGYAAFLLPSGFDRIGSSSAVKLPTNRTEALAAFLRLFQCSHPADIHDVIPVMQPDCPPEGLFGPLWGVVMSKGKQGGNDCWMWCRHADALDSCSTRVRHLEGREIGEKRSGTTMPASTGWLSSDLLASVADSDGTIVMTTVNRGMVDFAINWAKSLHRQGVNSFLVICLDDRCFDLLSTSFPENVVRAPKEVRVSAAATIFNTESFGALVMTRPFFVREIVQRGYTVLYNDVDMVWLRNALDFMPSRRFDVALQIDANCFCSCLMLFRPTEGALSLLDQWGQLMHKETRRNITYNNPYLKEAVKNLRNSVSIASLSPAFFPSGPVFLKTRRGRPSESLTREERKDVVIVHVNWVLGRESKKRALIKHRLWDNDVVSLLHGHSTCQNQSKLVSCSETRPT